MSEFLLSKLSLKNKSGVCEYVCTFVHGGWRLIFYLPQSLSVDPLSLEFTNPAREAD